MQQQPYIWPYSSDYQPPRGRRIFSRQGKKSNVGSLNIFGASNYASATAPSAAKISSLAPPTPRPVGVSPPPAQTVSRPSTPTPEKTPEVTQEVTPAKRLPYASREQRLDHSKHPATAVPAYLMPPAGIRSDGRRSASQPAVVQRGDYVNMESTSTREFPKRGLKKVAVTPHVEPPHGVKFFRTASATQQNVQVVNITNAYKDPTQMVTPRQGLRCVRRSASCASEMRDIMEYKATPQQLRGETLQVPVGVQLKEVERHAPIDYSNLERFTQAVRDHCRQRARGITQFYVSLCRNMVGGSTPSTPRVLTPRLWALEQEPETHSLTLLRCRDQLVALTCIPVTLREIGSLMWDLDAIKLPEGQPPLSDEDLQDLKVTYTDFSTAFADHPECSRLSRMKIA